MRFCLIIFIFGLVDSAPKSITFDSPVFNIDESVTTDKTIGSLTSTESQCRIKSTKPSQGPFTLSGNGGNYDIVFKYGSSYTKLDYSTTPTYQLYIQCGSEKNDVEVDVHPNPPPSITNWPSVTVTVKAQETVKGDNIYTIEAEDVAGEKLSYTMYSNLDLGYFNIDPTTGQISAAKDLSLATVDVIPLKVNVSDGQTNVGPFTVYVRLEDMNSRPVFTNLPNNVTIREDAVAGDTLIQLTFSDNDVYDTENFNPTCSVNPKSENYKFEYDIPSRKLKLATVPDGDTLLDYETTSFYNISCVINDGYLDSEGAFLNVYVKNVNEPPEFSQPLYTCNLYESKAGVSTCDLPITITEPDDQDYDITLLPGNNSDRFVIDDNNKLTFQTNYDVDNNVMPDTVTLTIAAVDSGGTTGTSKIQVNIRDVNDNAPDFGTTGQNYDIGGDTSLGVLGSIVADDPDSGSNGELTYSVTGGSAQALAYVNVLGNGEIRYSNQYDYSLAGETFYLEVTAKDKGSPQQSSTSTIAVSFQTTTTTPVPPTVTQLVVVNNADSSSTSFLDDNTNVGLLAALLSLLALAALAALLCCCCCKGNTSCFSGGESRNFCDCFSKKQEVEEIYETKEYRPRVRKIRRIVQAPEPEVVEEKPKHVVVEEFVEEPQMVSTVVPYTPSIGPYGGEPEYVTEIVPYYGNRYDNGYYGYDNGYNRY